MERQSIMKNKYLAGSNIDVFKNTHKLADININKARGSTPSGPVHVPQHDRKQTNFDRLYNNRLIQESQRASNASSTIQHENDDKDLE